MAACARCGAALPAEARFCPACAAPVEAAPPAEERKLATVLFADLVGSTELADDQDPERTRAVLDRFYDAMAAEIEGAGGTVEKFAGDAVMAAFGAPAAHEDHPERALHAALSMRHRLDTLFEGRLALRIGVNTGDVVIGRPREGSSFVTGDAVNVAARLEQAAAPGDILVGERTARAARGAFEFDDAQTVEAKGKPGGVQARRLRRALSLMRPRGVGGLRRAFVGRDDDLARLEQAFRDCAVRRDPTVVTVVGEAGVGKTRLARELWERLADETPEPLRRTGRCLPYGRGITYWPLGEILKEHLGILESDEPDRVRAQLSGREILGLTLGLDVAGELHPLAARDRLREAWVELLEELTAERPVVVLVEDLHWAEDPLLDLLEHLARHVRGPLLLIGTARPELLDRRPGFGRSRGPAEVVWLEALEPDAAGELVAALVPAELPLRVRELVVERAEGNPFFVEEVLATLIDRGVLTPRDGGFAIREVDADVEIPDSVRAVLAARIDLLPATEKAALQAAAVIGRTFWSGPVYELLEGLEPDFRVLEDRDFVRRRAGSSLEGEPEYAFKHALTREVAYSSLPKARRARLHAAFARWVERMGSGRDEHAPLLAHHFAEAVRPEDADLAWAGADAEAAALRGDAVRWLRRAAVLALGRYAIEDGIALLERALELETGERERPLLWRELGRAHALRYDGEAFWAAMERAFEGTDDPRLEAELYADLAFETTTRSGIWRRMPESELVEGWTQKALELAEPESLPYLKALLARARWDPEHGAEAAVEATALAERLGDPVYRSFAFDVRGIAQFVRGEYELGKAWAERRFEFLDQISDPDHRAEIHAAPISGCIWSGRFREARRLARAHDELASPLTPHHRVHAVAILLEVEELAAGWETVAALQARTEDAVAENLETPCVRNPRSLLVCAAAQTELGDEAAAHRLEERAREVWMEGYGSTLDAPLLRLALLRGDLDEAERLVGVPELRGWHRGWFFFSALTARLDALAALGRREEVEAEASRHRRPGTYLEPFAVRALGIVREDDSLLERAAADFAAMGLDRHASQTRALF
ncbi:MAG TPA: adenylate/guanylate cyclase domain-containing protein [Gaiellaceae bacterium]